ncbi:Sua5/YciO/YrdC/YwlC family protein [Clostridiales bacterium 1_7_47FAA]|nr:Sua5/YciO/YrdC/YwlC family protein [Clostridiales bacterium 1_7_47FAA]
MDTGIFVCKKHLVKTSCKKHPGYRGNDMETKRIMIEDRKNIKDEELAEAAAVLKGGGLVAFPTETVYGLGGNALDEDAARKIYAAKGRPSDNPLIAHISCAAELAPLVREIPEAGRKLMEAFWPGPLTMIFPKSSKVPYGTTGGLDTVAVRMPDDPVASRLIALAGVPVAAPSANTSGRPSPTTADHVWQDMNGRIDMIIDGGPVGIGVESTIVDVSSPVPSVLRPGAITMEMLREVLGEVAVDPAILGPVKEDVKPKAPGMKYRHYAPKAELTLVETTGPVGRMVEKVKELAHEKLVQGCQVGIICTDESRSCYAEGTVRSIGARESQESVAHNLYAVLREFDDLKVEYIFSESFSEDHLGQAIMNRLSKAAGYKIVQV